MRFALLLLLLLPLPAWANPNAVVRIKSHGATGVVIYSQAGYSYILSCAHMLDSKTLGRAIKLDGPAQPHAPARLVTPRLVAYDHKADLSLIYLPNGPFYSVPVSPTGQASGQAHSLGYDEMRWPITHKTARVLGSSGSTTYTDQKPWHGRSGGALVDAQSGYLIGIVQGYEVRPGGRGLYVSHAAIVSFLQRHAPGLVSGVTPGPAPRGVPQVQQHHSPRFSQPGPIC